ncbi:hypothetical protein GLYMA_13G185450v4 [Glycine max]|nr:hypothetical protein GLYMA_13G185450v4 [Glycine max]
MMMMMTTTMNTLFLGLLSSSYSGITHCDSLVNGSDGGAPLR